MPSTAWLDRLDEGVVVVDGGWRCKYMNTRAAAAFDKRPEELLGRNLWNRLTDRGRALYAADLEHAMTARVQTLGEGRHTGDDHVYEVRCVPDGDDLVVLIRDVSDRYESERELVESRQRLRASYLGNPVPSYTFDERDGDWVLTDLNEAASTLTMGWADRQVGVPVTAIFRRHPDLLADFGRCHSTRRTMRREVNWVLDGSGVQRHFDITMVWLPPHGVLVHTVDLTEQRRFEDRLRVLADRDALTGLMNRRRVAEELEHVLATHRRTGRPAATIVLDVDQFKGVNDTLGHAAGDQVIQHVARVLGTRIRDSDRLARLGGDEFAVVLEDTDAETAAKVAQALVEGVRAGVTTMGGEVVRLTVSAGVAELGGAGARGEDSVSDLLSRADLAMYEAKRNGGDRVAAFRPSLMDSVRAGRTWAERIRGALEDDSFVLHRQPIVDVTTGDVVRWELLLRLQAERGGLIGPGVFLPVAERFGLMGGIDRWVVRSALALAAKDGIPVAVNLSGASVSDPDMRDWVEAELRSSGLAAGAEPGLVTFEITETTAIQNLEEASGFVQRLGALGARVALDDFGAGFGSFFYLKHCPVHEVKVDGGFVRGLAQSKVDQSIVQAVVLAARGAGQTTVAEFVEDEPTLDLLRSFGVDLAQGYLLGRPEPLAGAGAAPPRAGGIP